MHVTTTTPGHTVSDTNPHNSHTQSGSSQHQTTMEQIQQQVNQLMLILSKGSKTHNIPEDHIQIASLAYSMMTYISHKLHNVWIIDTGGSNQMCCDAQFMTDIVTTIQPFRVALPNSEIILVNP